MRNPEITDPIGDGSLFLTLPTRGLTGQQTTGIVNLSPVSGGRGWRLALPPRMRDVGSTAEEPLVCTTLRWREGDSNLYGAFPVKSCFWFFCSEREAVLRPVA